MSTSGSRDRDRDSRGGESRGGEFAEKVVKVRRCATVVKGGRRFSFAGLVVVGNGRGKVGCGYAKANEVPPAVEKAIKDGMKNLIEVPVEAGTIPHRYGLFADGHVRFITNRTDAKVLIAISTKSGGEIETLAD